MKKWHMENIVHLSGTKKLALPAMNQSELNGLMQTRDDEKEFFLIPVLRTWYAVLLKML